MTGFIRQLRALDPDLELALTTNGILLASMAAELKAADLNWINVSLDSLRPERFREITRRDGLGDVLAGLQRAAAAGFAPLKINIMPIRGVNDDEIEAFAALARDNPWEIRFIEYIRSAKDSITPACSASVPTKSSNGCNGWGSSQPSPRPPVPARPTAIASRLHRSDRDHPCGLAALLRRVQSPALTADGRLRPCLFSTEEIDLRSPLRAGASDQELRDHLLCATEKKPRGHRIGNQDFAPASRRMHGIGG